MTSVVVATRMEWLEKHTKFLAAYLSPKSRTFSNATRSAIAAGYKPKAAQEVSSRLLSRAIIRKAVDAWHAKTESAAVCSIAERKAILSEIARRDPADYVCGGKDGTYIRFGPESPNRRAVVSIKSRTEEDNDGVITDLRLADPVPAIEVLNKMDRLYHDGMPLDDERRGRPIVVKIVLRDQRRDVDVTVDGKPVATGRR